MYSQLAKLMMASYIACGEPTKILELFLSAMSRGVVKTGSLPDANWPTELLNKEDWRVSSFKAPAALPEIDFMQATKPLGCRIIALWAAAVAGQSVVISGKCAPQLAMLTPLLAGFPVRNMHGYDGVFPCFSPAAGAAVAAGATPASVAGEASQGPETGLADLHSAAQHSTGRVVATTNPQTASALLSRQSWWDTAIDADTGAVTGKGGVVWGSRGGAVDFPSPLHKAVWDFVQADLAAVGELPPKDALWKAAGIWQAAGDRFVLTPLRKLTEAHSGQLTRAALNQPSLAPAAQEFLWQAAHVLQGGGVEGVSLATEGVQGGNADESASV